MTEPDERRLWDIQLRHTAAPLTAEERALLRAYHRRQAQMMRIEMWDVLGGGLGWFFLADICLGLLLGWLVAHR
jgi:hypothetical protein